MNDDFLALFGGSRNEDEKDGSPSPPLPEGPVLATVVAALDGQVVARLPDGQQVLVDQELFEAVEREAMLPVFADEHGWSLLDPRWPFRGRAADSPLLERGAEVVFHVIAYDESKDGLVGRVGTHEAFAPRGRLPWPASFPDVDLSQVVGQSVHMVVADPLSEPPELAPQGGVKKLTDLVPLSRLYCLRTLAALKPEMTARVVGTKEQLIVDFLGRHWHVFPEDRGWTPFPSLPSGKRVDVRLSVDMGIGAFFLSLRSPRDPEWEEIQRRYPIGSIIEQGNILSLTHRGLLVEVPDRDFGVVGILRVYQFAPPYIWRDEGLTEVPLPLRVVGHSDDRCMLLLDMEPYIAARWRTATPRVGAYVPLNKWRWSSLDPVVIWDLGCRVTTTRKSSGNYEWGVVVESEPEERRLVVDPVGDTRPGRTRVNSEGTHIVFEDGTIAVPSERSPPRGEGQEVDTVLVGIRFHSGGMEPLVTVASRMSTAICKELERRQQSQEVLRGRICARVKGGLAVELQLEEILPNLDVEISAATTIKAFLPSPQVDLRPVKDLEALIGQMSSFVVIRLNKNANELGIVLSRRRVLKEQQRREKVETIKRLRVGQVVSGVVGNITDYGAFLDLGGADGLLHMSEMTYGSFGHPGEMLEVGQRLDVLVLEVDASSERVGLGLKQIQPGPWEEVEKRYEPGAIVRGRVVKLYDFGIIVELERGVASLVYYTELGWDDWVGHPGALFDINDAIEVQVLAVDSTNERIALSRKRVLRNPWEVFAAVFPPGSSTAGRIQKVMDYGVFVRLAPGITGLAHDHNMGPDGITIRPELKKRDAVRVVVHEIDVSARRVSLELISRSPYQADTDGLGAGTVLQGTVVDIDDHDIMVKLEGVEARGRIAWADVEGFLGGSGLLPVGTLVVVEVLSASQGDTLLRLGLREVLRRGSNRKFKKGDISRPSQGLVRVYELANVLGVESSVVLEGLTAAGLTPKTRSSKVNPIAAWGALWAAGLVDGTRHEQQKETSTVPVAGHDLPVEEGSPVPGQVPKQPRADSAATELEIAPVSIDRLRTRTGAVVNLGVLSARYAIRREDIEALYQRVAAKDVPAWTEPLELEVAVKLVEVLVPGHHRSTMSSPTTRPDRVLSLSERDAEAESSSANVGRTRKRRSLWVISSNYGIGKADLLALYDEVFPDGPRPSQWGAPLEEAVAERLIRRLSAPKATGAEPPTASFSMPAADRPVHTPSRTSDPSPRAPAPTADRGRNPSEHVYDYVYDYDSGVVTTSSGFEALTRYIVNRDRVRSDADEDDDTCDGPGDDDTHNDGSDVVGRPGMAAFARSGRDGAPGSERTLENEHALGFDPAQTHDDALTKALSQAERDWTSLPRNSRQWSALSTALCERGLTVVVSLLDPRVPPGEVSSEEWALAELAAVARSLSELGGEDLSPYMLDRILRCLAARPNDVLPWTVLARAVPPGWLLERIGDIEGWLRRHAIQPVDDPSMGRCLLVSRAARARGELRRAHEALGEWLRHAVSIDFRRERSELADWHRQEIVAGMRFFGRWTRRLDLEVGQGSFSVVLPVSDDETGETHALKHALLLDAVGADRWAAEVLFDREARMLRDLAGVGGLPRFVARPESEVLVCTWIEGQTLDLFLGHSGERKRWGPREVALFGRRISEVLRDIQEVLPRFAHNDLAPRNVMIPPGGPQDAILIDFGISAHADGSVSSLMDELDLELRVGFQAPEVREGSRATPQSDMYSLGLILLAALAGDPKPVASSAVERAVEDLVFGRRDQVSRKLGRVLQSLLGSTPIKRPTTWHDVAQQFEGVCDE